MRKTVLSITLFLLSFILSQHIYENYLPKKNLDSCRHQDISKNFNSPIVIRVVKEQSSKYFDNCILTSLRSNPLVKLIDRENENFILEELTHQSEIPTEIESTIPIGSLLSPDHLMVLRNNQLTISRIATGTVMSIIPLKISDQQFLIEQKKNLIIQAGIWLLIFVTFLFLSKPVKRKIEFQDKAEKVETILSQALTHIQEGSIHKGSEILTQVAKSDLNCAAKKKARKLLHELATKINLNELN